MACAVSEYPFSSLTVIQNHRLIRTQNQQFALVFEICLGEWISRFRVLEGWQTSGFYLLSKEGLAGLSEIQ